MSSENESNNNKRKEKPIVGMPSEEAQERHREKPLASGRRRNQGVINLRSTGDNNYMKVVRDQHERRKLFESEANRNLPKDTLIWDPKKPLKGTEVFKEEKEVQRRTNRRPDDTPITQT